MDVKILIGFGFVIFASLSTQLNNVILGAYPKLTESELGNQHPELAWIRVVYPIFSVLWFLIFGFFPIFLIIRPQTDPVLPSQAVFYILGGAIGSFSILNGVLGLLTNFIPLPKKRYRLFVYDENIQPVSLLLMAIGVFVIIIALAMIDYYVI